MLRADLAVSWLILHHLCLIWKSKRRTCAMLIHRYILAPPIFYSNLCLSCLSYANSLLFFLFEKRGKKLFDLVCIEKRTVSNCTSRSPDALFTRGFRYCTVEDAFWAVPDEWNTLLIIADSFMSIATGGPLMIWIVYAVWITSFF